MSVSRSFLIIQTAFIGDVILATALIEKLNKFYSGANIDFLLRKGNEGLLVNHPHLRKVLIWDKKKGKIRNLFKLVLLVRARKYDSVINIHRFASSGLITAFSGANNKIGFDKNPWSFAFTKKIKHDLGSNLHEVERNQKLIEPLTDELSVRPRLYPTQINFDFVSKYKKGRYLCIAPSSVWFTKEFPASQWVEFINTIKNQFENIYLIGAPSDKEVCNSISIETSNEKVINLAGELSFLESAALMKDAEMNYVNDSAPMHLASAINAPVTAVFCSTVPAFGFGPLSDRSFIVQTPEQLSCRPCGLHGYKSCPEGHFKCATSITTVSLQKCLVT